MGLSDTYEQWYFQSDYDLETTEYMLQSGRNTYCVFMCHLSLEKALKGLYFKRTKVFPIKTHNLLYFVEQITLEISSGNLEFLGKLNQLSIVTRYPENLQKLMRLYSTKQVERILQQSKLIQQWIKQQ
jgi:HEPN domain-containing protein